MIAPARLAAYEVLRSVASGRVDLGTALATARRRLPDERDRALAGEIATGTLRWQGAFDHVIKAFANRPFTKLDPEVIDILRLTMFQLLHLIGSRRRRRSRTRWISQERWASGARPGS